MKQIMLKEGELLKVWSGKSKGSYVILKCLGEDIVNVTSANRDGEINES